MKFIRGYKAYQLYKNDNIEMSNSDSTGASRLIKNDILIFLPDTVIELGKEIKSLESEDKAIEYIDNSLYIQEKFNSAVDRAEQENERQDRLRALKEDERLKFENSKVQNKL